jgi:hypothetical protein
MVAGFALASGAYNVFLFVLVRKLGMTNSIDPDAIVILTLHPLVTVRLLLSQLV